MDRILEINESEATILIQWKSQPLEKSTWEDIEEVSPIPETLLAEYNYRLRVDARASEPKVQKQLERWRQRPFQEFTEQPKHIAGGTLKDYQLEGINWMMYNLHNGSNSILADDMGLGKTVQVAAFLAHAFHEFSLFPALIVVPNATIANWMRELEKWAPKLVCVEYRGCEAQRNVMENHIMFNPKSVPKKLGPKGPMAKSLMCHVVVTTYEIATLYPAMLKKVNWQVAVVDEAHRLKNDEAKLFVKLMELNLGYKICLTGTPLQNNLRELFNLMSFLSPADFTNAEEMSKEYANLNSELVSKLHEQLRPFFLRRTKEEVLKGILPPKKEVFVPVSMTRLQRELYRAALMRNVDLLASLKGSSTAKVAAKRSSLNNILVELRKIMMHPYLMDDVEPMGDSASPEVIHNRLIGSSAKLALLHRLLQKLKAGGHRVLIFSQWTKLLDILEDYLNGERINYGRLDGKCDADEKQRAIDKFNAPHSEQFVFLVSTRAGGQGVNLASADTIIIYDSDFNPHMDIQAMARCHRIGQTKPVLILKIFVKQSAEEKILEMAAKKLLLDHVIVEQMDAKEESVDLESVLRFGAHALFEEDDTLAEKKAITYTDKDIDELIDRAQITEVEEDSGNPVPNKVFGYAKSWKAAESNSAAKPADPSSSSFSSSPNHRHKDAHDDVEMDSLVEPDAAKADADSDSFWNTLLQQRIEVAQAGRSAKEALGKGKRLRTNFVRFGYQKNTDYGDLADVLGDESPVSKKRKGRGKDGDGDSIEFASETNSESGERRKEVGKSLTEEVGEEANAGQKKDATGKALKLGALESKSDKGDPKALGDKPKKPRKPREKKEPKEVKDKKSSRKSSLPKTRDSELKLFWAELGKQKMADSVDLTTRDDIDDDADPFQSPTHLRGSSKTKSLPKKKENSAIGRPDNGVKVSSKLVSKATKSSPRKPPAKPRTKKVVEPEDSEDDYSKSYEELAQERLDYINSLDYTTYLDLDVNSCAYAIPMPYKRASNTTKKTSSAVGGVVTTSSKAGKSKPAKSSTLSPKSAAKVTKKSSPELQTSPNKKKAMTALAKSNSQQSLLRYFKK
ncbi:P-loop containing nucleoside triphosphate hydrolase protein [Chytridium lagenaria]|nr:P-loop containing nucleoside triphosphate hydrolase protein [Chytridium lagenaria]